MKLTRGQINLFQNASLLMCSVALQMEKDLASVGYVIGLLFKVQFGLNHNKLEWRFYVQARFANFTAHSMEFPITNCLPFSFEPMGIFVR